LASVLARVKLRLKREKGVVRVMPPLLMETGRRPRWWWKERSAARRLGIVACWFAVAAALVVVSLCFVGGALASGKLN
jgi:hypothetical protein